MRRWPRPLRGSSRSDGNGLGQALARGERRNAVAFVVQQQRRQRNARAEPRGLVLLQRHTLAALDLRAHARRDAFGQPEAAGEPGEELRRWRRGRDQCQALHRQAARRGVQRGQRAERMRDHAVQRPEPRRGGEDRPRELRQRGAPAAARAMRREVEQHRIETLVGERVGEPPHLAGAAGPAVHQQHQRPARCDVAAPVDGEVGALEGPVRDPPGRRQGRGAPRASTAAG